MASAIERVNRLKTQLANIKAEAKAAANIGVRSTLVVGGGAAAGVIAARMPFLPRTTVPTAGAVGTAAVLLAMTGVLDEHADNVALIGAGMLAAVAARETEKLLAAG